MSCMHLQLPALSIAGVRAPRTVQLTEGAPPYAAQPLITIKPYQRKRLERGTVLQKKFRANQKPAPPASSFVLNLKIASYDCLSIAKLNRRLTFQQENLP